jgi:polysaccharide biosynthesis protein PslG
VTEHREHPIRRRWPAALLAAAAAALAPAPPAQGALPGVQDDRLGVVPLAELPARLDLIRASGARIARVDVFWSQVAPTRPARPQDPADRAYRWERLDRIVKGLRGRGIAPLLVAYDTPAWAAGGRTAPPASPGYNPWMPAPPAYGRFMGALARRYSGAYRDPAGGRLLPRVRLFEIWNEPNLQLYFRPQYVNQRVASIANYARLVRAAYPRIKRANRGAVVIAGASGPKTYTRGNGIGAMPWLVGLVRSGAPFDAYSQHISPAAAPREPSPFVPSWSTVPDLLRALDAARPGIPLYVTEASYTTSPTPFRRVVFTIAQQRAYLRQIFALPVVRGPRVPAVIWFNLQDNPSWPGGLLLEDGSPKPSFAAFRRVATGSRARTR